MKPTFRTKATHDRYQAHIKAGGLKHACALCTKLGLEDFTYWRIMPNDYPYDAIASVHHMLVLKRHDTESGLTDEERHELIVLKETTIPDRYTFFMEALKSAKSIPNHLHFHLIIPRDLGGT